MSFCLVWRLNSLPGVILASDSLTTIRDGSRVVRKTTQKTISINSHFPVGAVTCGSAVAGKESLVNLLSQNYQQERDSLEGFSHLIHEEIREALKYRHPAVETTNFAIHLAGYCVREKSFQHYVISTVKLDLQEPRKVKSTLFVGGNVGKAEVKALRSCGMQKDKNYTLEEACEIVKSGIEKVYEIGNSKVSGPTQILYIDDLQTHWLEGPIESEVLF